MVGAYRLVDGKGHGFLLSAGQFITIDYPGSRGTIAGGISSSGDIVGAQFDDQFNLRGFLLRKGQFSSIDSPGAKWTFPAMIVDDRIVGAGSTVLPLLMALS